jgi:protein-S-isoprenylcysteine O-methyltransferase Ste14
MKEEIMKEKKGEHPFGDTGQLIGFGVFLIVWIGDSYFLRLSTFLSDYVPLVLRLGILALSIIVALCLFGTGHEVAHREQKLDRVVTTGSFRFVRHPLYSASILVYIGLTIVTLSLFSLAVLMGIFIFYDFIAGYEEKLLEAQFGEEYRRFKRRTGKWIPKIGTGR